MKLIVSTVYTKKKLTWFKILSLFIVFYRIKLINWKIKKLN